MSLVPGKVMTQRCDDAFVILLGLSVRLHVVRSGREVFHTKKRS